MAIRTRVQTRYTIQKLATIAVCLVLGLWGVYDYVFKIPAQERTWARGEVYRLVKSSIEEAGSPDTTVGEARAAAGEAIGEVDANIQALIAAGMSDDESAPDPDRVREALEARNDEQWFQELVLFRAALTEIGQNPRGQRSDAFVQVFELLERRVDQAATVSKPSTFDRMIQWAFILCLPFVPLATWQYLGARRRTYVLDEDGTLHSPAGDWSEDEIADVDMSRWMSKSIATVVHEDGTKVELDDFVHKNVHLIVGRLAHARYPDQWHEDARQVKGDAAAKTAAAGDEAGPDEGETHDARPENDTAAAEPVAEEESKA